MAAAGERVLSVRVAGYGGAAAPEIHGTTDALLLGLERAVDPDGDGAADDAVRVALVGVNAPYAGFGDSPEAQAARGAAKLGTLVVAPAGNEGPARPPNGVVGSPGAARSALAAGATEAGAGAARVDVTIGERKLQRAAVLGGTPPADAPLAGPVDATDAEALLASGPRLTGHVALVRAGADPVAQATAAASAGATAVLLAEPRKRPLPLMPAGRVAAPVIGLTGDGGEGRARREARRHRQVRPRDARSGRARRRGDRPRAVLLARPGARRHAQAGRARSRRGRRSGPRRRGGAGRGHRGRCRAGGGAGRPARAGAAGRDRGGGARGARPRRGGRGERGRRPRRRCRWGALRLTRREGEVAGVRFTLGAFDRGDPLAGGTRLEPAARLELALVDDDGVVRRRLTPPGGARDLLPAEYAYTLPARGARAPRRRHLPLPRHGPGAPLQALIHAPLAGLHGAAVSTVTLYTRPGCHLCDDARAAIERVRERTPFSLVEIDIESDDALHRAYLERIPVVELDGEELFEHFVDEATLAARIRRE